MKEQANDPVNDNQDADNKEENNNTSPSAAPEEGMIKALQAQIAEMKDRLLRAAAETENMRKRAEREREDTSKYAVTGFARDLVDVGENLRRALDAIAPDAKEKDPVLQNLAAGVEMTLKELLGAFERHGIRRLDPFGEKFDHNFHQAVAQIETPDTPPGHIAQVLAAGYVIHDRLLRPAMVGVAKAPGSDKAPPVVDTSA